MLEKFNFFNNKSKQNLESEDKKFNFRLLSKAESALKISAMLVLLGLSFTSQAQTPGSYDNVREIKKEQMKDEAKDKVNRLEDLVFNYSAPRYDKPSETINGTLIKSRNFGSGEKVIVAEDYSFIILSLKDGKEMFIDLNADGSIDRIILNNEKIKDGSSSQELKDYLYAFSSAKEIANSVSGGVKSKPEDISIISFNRIDHLVTSNDLSANNDNWIARDDNADHQIDSAQKAYMTKLDNLLNNN